MERVAPLPPEALRVIELGRRGYSLREIAGMMGYSYGYLRNKLYRLRRRGYDVPLFKAGRKKRVSRGDSSFSGFRQEVLPSGKLSSLLKHYGRRGWKSRGVRPVVTR